MRDSNKIAGERIFRVSADRPAEKCVANPMKKIIVLTSGMTGVALVAVIDWVTGPEVGLSLFYLLPIGAAAWYGGNRMALSVSAAAAVTWFLLDERDYSHAFIPYWNALVRMGFFVLTAFLLSRVQSLTESLEARVDQRTAALNSEIERRKEREAGLRESETLFRQLAENIREVFWISDPEKKEILYVSSVYETVWGRPCASLLAAPRAWMEAIHPDDRARVREAALTKQISGDYDEEYRVVQPNGAVRWIQDRAFPVRDDAGRVYRLVGIAEDITRRKEWEATQAMLAQALESTEEMICVTDLEDRFIYVNRAFKKGFGYAPEEILGRTPAMLYSPNSPPFLMAEVLAQTRRGGWQGEVLDRRKDGTEFPVFLSTSQIMDKSGDVIGLIGVAQDITTRKRADKQNAVFAGLGHKLGAVALPKDAAGTIMDAASELFGWDAGYLHLYSSSEDRIIPILTVDTVDGQRMPVPESSFTLDPSPVMRRVMDAGAELINRTPDAPPCVPLVPFGDTGRPSASMMYVPIESCSAIIGVLSIQSYTTGAYSPEDLALLQVLAHYCGNALQRITLAAAASELASIVENSADAIHSKSLHGTIISWNKGAERLYGYKAEEIVGRSNAVLIPPERHDDLTAILERIADERTDEFETTRIRKDGTRIEVSLTFSPIRDETGRITGLSAIARDITERKRLELEIAGISHDEQQRLAYELHDHLGAYLAGTAFWAKTLAENLSRRRIPESEEALRLVELINNGTDQVRTFARMLAPVEVDSGGLAAALARLGAEMESLYGITCFVHTGRNLPPLSEEQSIQLYRIAQEGARNAVKHGKAKRIEISVQCGSDLLSLTVRNDGAAWVPLAEPDRSLGLRIMGYRAGILGGNLFFQPEPDGPPTIVCKVPVAALRGSNGCPKRRAQK